MAEATLQLPTADRKRTGVNIVGETIVNASKDLLSCELSDGAVILSLKSGVYYGLDNVGTWIWRLIQEPTFVRAILSALVEEYDVELERCEQDLRELLEMMHSLNLIEITDETA